MAFDTMIQNFILLIFCICLTCSGYESPAEYTFYTTVRNPPGAPINSIADAAYAGQIATSEFAFQLINEGICQEFLPVSFPNTTLKIEFLPIFESPVLAIQEVIKLSERGESFMIGVTAPETAMAASIAGSVYDVATLSSYAPLSVLADKRIYPYFSRVSMNNADLVETVLDLFLIFGDGAIGWSNIAVIAHVAAAPLDYAQNMVELSREKNLDIAAYRTVLIGDDVEPELTVIKNSGARVIYVAMNLEVETFFAAADRLGLVGDSYVYLSYNHAVFVGFSKPTPAGAGLIACADAYLHNDLRECYDNAWAEYMPFDFPAGSLFTLLRLDMMLAAALAAKELDRQELLDGRHIPAQKWFDTIVNDIDGMGVNGRLQFDSKGNRQGAMECFNYSPYEGWRLIRTKESPSSEFVFINDQIWHSNTTEIPDLDVRTAFDYWSCKDGEEREDKTGKTITLHTPDGSDIDEISAHYHCDNFIDCKNLSDESIDCSANYTIVFIVFAIIAGFSILVVVLLLVFVFIVGVILRYRRLKVASPYFLIMLLVSILVGYSSIFSFYGKPHPVGCVFQPWLLGLSAISMIAVLSVKNFRIYRIFKFPLKRTTVSDFELLILWFITILPGLIILTLWTIISTPTAKMETRDGVEHYVCTTGGFTGEPGGFVFFGIFVGYGACVLLVGAVVSILSRNAPSTFNESKLLTISIYNLGFLSAVIIPVYLVVNPYNTFIAWILRTVAVLYAFTATLIIQFAPPVLSIIFLDKGKDLGATQVSTTPSKSNERTPN